MVGCLAAGAAAGSAADKKVSAQSVKTLKWGAMKRVLHKSRTCRGEGGMRRIAVCCLASLACLGAAGAWGQGYPGGRPGGMGGGPQNIGTPDMSRIPSEPSVEKPDASASKA